jgi:hypothetical protein
MTPERPGSRDPVRQDSWKGETESSRRRRNYTSRTQDGLPAFDARTALQRSTLGHQSKWRQEREEEEESLSRRSRGDEGGVGLRGRGEWLGLARGGGGELIYVPNGRG